MPPWIESAYHLYAQRRHTLGDLAAEYRMHPKTLRRYFDQYAGATGEVRITAENIVMIADAFYFARGDGVLVCRTVESVLYWRMIVTESIDQYAACLSAVLMMRKRVQAVVIDGRKGVRQFFLTRGMLVQCCQFHQIKTIKDYIPARAKTEAAQTLRSLAMRLCDSTSIQFTVALDVWHVLYGEFLHERTYGTLNKRHWQYTHRRLRSAYRSLRTNLPWLFTFEQYPTLHISNTTNHCDGLFAHVQERIGIHRGIAKTRKKQMLDYILEQYRE